MNKPITKKICSAVIVILTVIASFWFGGYVASNQTVKSTYRVQANLAFRHFKAYDEIHSYLNSDCKSQAMKRLEFLVNGQKMLMAEYVQSTDDKKFEEYVSLRSPGIIEELRHYKVDRNKKLTISECEVLGSGSN